MNCNRCGHPMMLETVIKLRRSIIGFKETRSQGAYCLTCRISVPIESPRPTTTRAIARSAQAHASSNVRLPVWLRNGALRSGFHHPGAIPAGDPVSRAR
jgi:hypothetical protein